MASNNIQQALERIKSIKRALASYGVYLELPELQEDSKLEQVKDAYLAISKGIPNRRDLESGEEVAATAYKLNNKEVLEISAGYYPKDITVTGVTSQEDQDAAIADAIQQELLDLKNLLEYENVASEDDVVAGKEIVKIVEVNGKLEKSTVEGTLGSTVNPFTISGHTEAQNDGETEYVTISGNGTTNLLTNIVYRNSDIPVNIRVLNSAEGEKVAITESLDPGYYGENSQIVISVKDNDDDIGTINVKSTLTVNAPGEYNAGEGFDYIKKVVVDLPTASTSPVIKQKDDGSLVTIIPAGYYEEDKEVSLSDGENEVTIINTSDLTPSPKTTTDEQTGTTEVSRYEIVVPKGYNPEESIIPLDKATVALEPQAVEGGFTVVIKPTAGWIEDSVDVTSQFADLADSYAEAASEEAEFKYSGELDEAEGGIAEKQHSEGKKYFTEAKVDLSELIEDMDNI